MLRMYLAEQWSGLSDENIEDAIYDSQAICAVVGIDLSRQSSPDATRLLGFRHRLESKELKGQICNAINVHLDAKGLMMREGTIVGLECVGCRPGRTRCCVARRAAAFGDTGYHGVEKRPENIENP